MPSDNGWNEWSKYVLSELKRLNDNYEELGKDIRRLEVSLASFRGRTVGWCAGVAFLISIIGILVRLGVG